MKLSWIIAITLINSIFIMLNAFGMVFGLAALDKPELLSIFQRVGVGFVTLLPLLALLSVGGLWYAYSKDFSTKWYYLGLLPFILLIFMGMTMLVLLPSQDKTPEVTHPQTLKKTKRFLERIEVLPEIPLPDEWYLLPNTLSFDEKFQKIAEKQAELSLEDIPITDRINEIKEQYCNKKYQLFKHTVYFNKLVSPDHQVDSYNITIVSCSSGIYTSIKALEVLEFEKTGKELSTEKQEILNKIFK